MLIAAFKALAVLLVWKFLLFAWTWSTPMTEHQSSLILSTTATTTGKIMTVVDAERRIRELEARHIVDLQSQLDEYDGILEQIREARQDLQPLRERVEQIRRHGVAMAAAESTLDPTVLDDGVDAAAAVVAFPHLEALVSHLRQRQAGVKGEGDDKDDDDDTARVRELFFRARKELYEHSQQQSAASMEEADAGASPPRRGNNYTRANAILQSYAELNNWSDMLPPPRCPAPSDSASSTTTDAASSLSALTPAQIDEWMSSNPDVQDRIQHVQQLIGDRIAVDDREWKVGLEATFEKVQERYMELAVHTNQVVFRTMKELQEHLDHWEVREAQKGINPNNNDLQAANNTLGGVCVQTSQVLHWIDVGLDAHYRNRSVREAIATALLHDDTLDEDHVQRAAAELVADPVPDDDDDDSNNNLRFRSRRRRRRYLRLLLDTPLLHESEKWIDEFVDWIEGRNDHVDLLVDLLASRAASSGVAQHDGDPALASSSSQGEASIGRYLVRSFLEAAGALDDTVHRMLARP
jgi:hypothetical protein